jgi:hypothetical protein
LLELDTEGVGPERAGTNGSRLSKDWCRYSTLISIRVSRNAFMKIFPFATNYHAYR